MNAKKKEQAMINRNQDFITLVRAANRDIWDGINALVALQREWNALDYGNTLEVGAGENTGIAAADVGAVVFDALVAVLADGHATNMAKLL